MAIVIEYKPQQLINEINKYKPATLRITSYRTIEILAEKVKKDVHKKYKQKGFFKDPVPLTLDSTFAKNYRGKAEVDIFPKDDKTLFTNTPRNYLYPVIGGGSPRVYETRFNQWLKANKYMKRNQYAFPNKKYPEMILTTGTNKRVIPNVYANTQRALRKTDAKGLKYNAQGSNIQDARVFAMKDSFPKKSKNGKANKYKPGIYRVSLKGGSKSRTFIKPLFFFTKTPNVKPKTVTFYDLVKESSDKNVGKIFLQQLNKFAK